MRNFNSFTLTVGFLGGSIVKNFFLTACLVISLLGVSCNSSNELNSSQNSPQLKVTDVVAESLTPRKEVAELKNALLSRELNRWFDGYESTSCDRPECSVGSRGIGTEVFAQLNRTEGSEKGVRYFFHMKDDDKDHFLIVTVSNQGRDHKLPDYQLLDCNVDGTLEYRKDMNMAGYENNPVGYQKFVNQKLSVVCRNTVAVAVEKKNSIWLNNYSSIVEATLSGLKAKSAK